MRQWRRRAHRATVLVALALVVAVPAIAGPEETAATVCAACHGERGVSAAAIFPNLAAQQADYLAKQLEDFASGKRRNEIMDATLATVKDSEFEGLAAYFAAQKPAGPDVAASAAVRAAGRRLYRTGNEAAAVPACSSCHQEDGVGSERYPRLASQKPEYTLKQLQDFRSGARGNDKGRVMRVVSERLSENDMKALAEYLGSL